MQPSCQWPSILKGAIRKAFFKYLYYTTVRSLWQTKAFIYQGYCVHACMHLCTMSLCDHALSQHVHREGNQAFRDAMASLEKDPCVRGLSFTSFLILPFQRITRLKLLVQVTCGSEKHIKETLLIEDHTMVEWWEFCLNKIWDCSHRISGKK